jgi:hypothetical protein
LADLFGEYPTEVPFPWDAKPESEDRVADAEDDFSLRLV